MARLRTSPAERWHPPSPEAVAWSLEGALYRVVGDPDEPGLPEAEWRRREELAGSVFEACGADLAALNDTMRHQRAVVAVLRAGLDGATTSHTSLV